MSCPQLEHEVAAYLDGELDLASAVAFERHLEGCPECTRSLAYHRELREAIGRADLRFRPSPAQTRRLLSALPPAAPRWTAGRLQALAALLLVAIASWSLGRFGPRPGPDLAQGQALVRRQARLRARRGRPRRTWVPAGRRPP
jgi:anti-sigma factor RsiW